jgi:hypothetical protein
MKRATVLFFIRLQVQVVRSEGSGTAVLLAGLSESALA